MAKVTLDRETFKALASETRLDLLRSLDERRKTGSELARDLELNKATVHEHLQLLDTVGLVRKVDEGRKWIYYELTWQGRKLLHPESGATFAVLLGLSFLSAGGAIASLGRALSWWMESSSPQQEGASEPLSGPEMDSAGSSDDRSSAQDTGAPEEVAFSETAPGDDASGGDAFFDDGGTLALVLMALTALFLALAMVLRFRGARKS